MAEKDTEVERPLDSGAEKNAVSRSTDDAFQNERTEELFRARDSKSSRSDTAPDGARAERSLSSGESAARDKAAEDTASSARKGDAAKLESNVKNAFEEAKGDPAKFRDFGNKLGDKLKNDGIQVNTKASSLTMEKGDKSVKFSMSEQLNMSTGKVDVESKAESPDGQDPKEVIRGFASEKSSKSELSATRPPESKEGEDSAKQSEPIINGRSLHSDATKGGLGLKKTPDSTNVPGDSDTKKLVDILRGEKASSADKLLEAREKTQNREKSEVTNAKDPEAKKAAEDLLKQVAETQERKPEEKLATKDAPNERDNDVVIDKTGLRIEFKGNVSPEFRKKMLEEIAKLPEADRKLLANDGQRIVVAGKISEIEPSLKDVKPRGWPEGKTWDDADGAHFRDKKIIAVTENTNAGKTKRAEGVLRHEVGHAIDQALKDFSQSPEFKAAYDKDVEKLSPFDRAKQQYLLQTGEAGTQETFADVYGAINGASANPHQTQEILKKFPAVAELIKKRLGR